MLELQNFGHMITSTIWLDLHDQTDDVMGKNYDIINFNLKYLYLKET